MNRFVLVLLVACGSKPPPAAPVSNTEPAAKAAQAPGLGEARVIQRMQRGGVIELTGDHDQAMKQADPEMEAHCGPNAYAIVREGEESAMARDGTETRINVWRVHYECTGN